MTGAKPANFPSDSARGGQPTATHIHLGAKPEGSHPSQLPTNGVSHTAAAGSSEPHPYKLPEPHPYRLPVGAHEPAHTATAPKVHPVMRALNAVGRIAKKAAGHFAAHKMAAKPSPARAELPSGGSHPSEPNGAGDRGGAEDHGGLGHRIVNGAKKLGAGVANIAGNFNDMAKAKARVRMPGLTYAIHGAPKAGELQAAQHLGLHREYQKMGHQLPGHEVAGSAHHEPEVSRLRKRSNSRRMGVGHSN